MTAATHFKAPRERKHGPPPIDRERRWYNALPGRMQRVVPLTMEMSMLIATCDCCGKLCCRRPDDRTDG